MGGLDSGPNDWEERFGEMFHRESIFSEPMGHEINLVIVTSIENKFELENIRVYCLQSE